jgi:hypothetical protein
MKRVLTITAILLLALMPVGVYADEIITEEADCEEVTVVSEETTEDIEAENAETLPEEDAADNGSSEEDDPATQDIPSSEPPSDQDLQQDEVPAPSEPSAPAVEPEAEHEEVIEYSPAPAAVKRNSIATAKDRIGSAVKTGSEYVSLKDLDIKFEDTPGFVDCIMSGVYMEGSCGFALISTGGMNNSTLAGVILFYDDCDCEEDCEDGYCDDAEDTVTPEYEYLAAEEEKAEDEVIDTAKIPSEPVSMTEKSEDEPVQNLPSAPIGAISVPVLLAAVTKYLH